MKLLSVFLGVSIGIALVLAIVVGSAMTMSRPMTFMGPVGVAPAVVPAIGQQQATAPAPAAPVDLKVEAKEWALTLGQQQVPAGAKVTVTLTNTGAIQHDFTLPAANFKLVADPGKSATGSFTLDKPGTYNYLCSIPGHEMAGMKGTLTVTGADGAAPAAQPAQAAQGMGGMQNMPGMQAAAAAVQPTPVPDGTQRLPLPLVAAPITRTAPQLVKVDLETKEITALVADGVATKVWTFNGTVPGPMIRVRVGDTVEVTLKNSADSQMTHSIDLHAVTGPGGGGKVTQISPGSSATFSFKALNPGVYVYHCATPMVAHHIANGMYGMIVVEPEQGLPRVDREFYVMQGEFYLQGDRGQQGLLDFDLNKMLAEDPSYIVFNGSVGSITKDRAFTANVGETVRIFFGVGGPNKTSSFHVIGEIFDTVYPEGGSVAQHNVQTTLVPAGGAAVVEFKTQVPGTYTMVDHSLGRLEKGAAGSLNVAGADNPDVFKVIQAGNGAPSSH